MSNAKGILRKSCVFLGTLALVVGMGTICRAQDKVVKVGNIIPLNKSILIECDNVERT